MNWGDEKTSGNDKQSNGKAVPILLSVILGLLVILYLNKVVDPPRRVHPWVGNKIEQASYQPLVNADQPIGAANFEGKVTLLNFWGPWCGYCLKEFPNLMEIRKEFSANSDFQYISVSSDGAWDPGTSGYQEDIQDLTETSTQALSHLGESDLPVYVDTYALSRSELLNYGPWSGFPTTMLIDREGKIADVWLGYQPNPEIIHQRIAEEMEKPSN